MNLWLLSLCSRSALGLAACLPLLLGLLTLSSAGKAETRPMAIAPKGVSTFDIGQQVNMNGLPMRLTGFVSALDAQEVADRFRTSLGQPLVENIVAGKLVLGRAEGDDFISVQIERAGSGTRGVIGVTNLKTAAENHVDSQARAQRWLDRFPAGSRVMSHMESQDAGKLSRHLVFSNPHDEGLNRERLIGLLRDQGLMLEREGIAAAQASADGRASTVMNSGQLLFFKGTGKDAMATIQRDGHGQTIVVLNIVTELETLR